MTKSRITILTGSSLLIAAGVAIAVLQPVTASKDNAASAAKTAGDSLKSTLHKRSFANKTASAKEDSVVDYAVAHMDFSKINYAAPDTVVTPPVTTNPGGQSSNPVSYSNKSNFNISNLSFDGGKNATVLIKLTNCSNVHITMCRFSNTKAYAIWAVNCTNVVIDYNFFTMVQMGALFDGCGSGCKWNNNQLLNLWNPTWIGMYAFSHAVQFRNCNGGGLSANYNKIENIAGVAANPHDIISVYQSNGLKGDSIQVIGNWLRGGQLVKWPTPDAGACGIVMGDATGTYQVARGNILVNPGAGGVANISNKIASTGIKIDHNKVFSISTPVTGQGIGIINATQTDCGYNDSNWTNSAGKNGISTSPYSAYYIDLTPKPLNWSTNKWADPAVTANILPAAIITYK